MPSLGQPTAEPKSPCPETSLPTVFGYIRPKPGTFCSWRWASHIHPKGQQCLQLNFWKIRINGVRNGKSASHFNSSPSQGKQDSLRKYEHCVLARTIPSRILKQWLTKVTAVHTACCVTGKTMFSVVYRYSEFEQTVLGMAQGSNSGWLTWARMFWLSFSRSLWEHHFTTF